MVSKLSKNIVSSIFSCSLPAGVNPVVPLMIKQTHSNNFLFPGVNNSHFLVFGSCADEAAIAIPAHIVDHIHVHVIQVDEGFSCSHIPDDDGIITA